MIIKYELEQFVKELEEKLPNLDDKRYEYWKDKIAILNRVNIEFLEYEELLRKVANMNAQTNIDCLKMQKELNDLRNEIQHLKKNING
jgi:hypothetical protein